MAGKTLIEQIIAKHLIAGSAVAGNEIKIRIDQTLLQDATGTMAFLELEAMGTARVKTEVSVQYVDHNTSQLGPENFNDHLYLQSVAAKKGVYFSRPGNGICHQVHLERFGVPGKTLLGSDSHTPTNGGLGMLAIGAGGLDVAAAMAGEPFKMTMPAVTGIKLSGSLKPWVAAKDVILHLLSILTTKGNVGTAVEYFGSGVGTLSVPERATITNMGAELGVTASVFPSDQITRAFLDAQGRGDAWVPVVADTDAAYSRIIEIDLSALEPLAACPSSPDNIRPVAQLAGIKVDQVIIGSCTNSSFKDLMLAATVLSGRRVHNSTSLSIAPGSRQVLNMLALNGGLSQMISAGARILESACGPCIGQGCSPASDTVTVRTFNRNFAGRTGTKGDQCYLVSTETAVAAALTGEFTDPRSLGIPYPAIEMPRTFIVDDGLILPPAHEDGYVDIVRKETIGEPPHCRPFPDTVEAEVLLHLGDKITTDHIMPAGTFLKFRSNIPRYAQFVFNCFNETGQPTFAERAAAVRDAGRYGAVAAGLSYGQGSSREHAAICPMFLGVRVIMARSIERIHAANLINFGILPLVFTNEQDYQSVQQGDKIEIKKVADQLIVGKPVVIDIVKGDETRASIECAHQLSEEDIGMLLAGGRLNLRAG